jgi:hypothetical protein
MRRLEDELSVNLDGRAPPKAICWKVGDGKE